MLWQLLVSLNCVQKDNASALSISTTSIRRHGLTLSQYFQTKTKQIMSKVASVSVMFDEASDIQMYKHLNIFVNVSTYKCLICYHVLIMLVLYYSA